MARKDRKRRARLGDEGGTYFAAPSSQLQFIHTGATALDCIVGGGWPLGRVVNIVGDKSTGKTLLAIEAMANFARSYPDGKIRYREAEAAFLPEYAGALGLPLDHVQFARYEDDTGEADTVEKFYDDLISFLDGLDGQPGLYILDSLDALSDESEVSREFGAPSYGTGKARQMSKLFRQVTSRVEASSVCLTIISQTRQRINAGFGRQYSRSGGNALDFYASIILYLAHLREIRRTVRGVKRPVGVYIRAKCTKNKIGLPFRQCDFPIVFAYGIEDISAGLDWLRVNRCLSLTDLTVKEAKRLRKKALRVDLEPDELKKQRRKISRAVKKGWKEVEQSFLPKQRKYP